MNLPPTLPWRFDQLDLKHACDILLTWITARLGSSIPDLETDLLALSDTEIRELIFPFFGTNEWYKVRQEILKALCRKYNRQIDNIPFQRTGSIRVYRPDALGTSFHADSWYGHGDQTYTIWIPIVEPTQGGSIHFVEDDGIDQTTHITGCLEKGTLDLAGANEYLAHRSKEILCPLNRGLLFHSSVIHGSLKNTSAKTRISIDLRFSLNPQNLGNKFPADFENISSVVCTDSQTSLSDENKVTRCLKYINGEFGHSTRTQHILINAYAKERNLNIVAQEAEIEGFFQPVLKYYVKNAQRASIDKILVLDRSMLAAFDGQELATFKDHIIVITEG
jgi:hypothetical protein